MNSNIIRALGMSLSLCSLPCLAQMDNVVEVENDFRPIVKDANKVNSLPDFEQAPTAHYSVEYTTRTFPTDKYAFQPIWAARNQQLLKPAKKGFATLGYGLNTNVTGRFAYTFDLSTADRLSFDLSSRGYKSDVDHIVATNPQWESRMFNTRVKAEYVHQLSPLSEFYVNAGYGTDVFNYQTLSTVATGTDKQHNDLIDLKIGLTPYQWGRFGISGEAELQTFNQKHPVNFGEGNSETLIRAGITPEYAITENLSADIDLNVDHASYGMDALAGTASAIDGYTSFDATPHVYWHNDVIDVKAGVYVSDDMDIAPDADVTFHVSPALDVYLEAHGGDVRNDFRRFASMSPYWSLASTSFKMENQFDQLRSRGGVRLKPVSGLSLDLSAGYDISKNRAEIADYYMSATSADYLYAPVIFADGKHFYANAYVRYNYKDIVTADLSTQYNKWDTDLKIAGIDTDVLWRPVFEADWSIKAQPVKNLNVGIDLLFETFDTAAGRYERDNTLNVGATASYTFPLGLTIYAKGDNLMNRKYDQYTMYRSPGVNFVVGAAITF